MMYNEILAKKVITFIIPTITLGASPQTKIHDYQKRQTLWQLLKSTMEKIEIPLIKQFEKNPTGHHLNEATINLLTMKFQEDRDLLHQIELFLDKQQDIEFDEKDQSKTGSNHHNLNHQNKNDLRANGIHNSFRTEWKRRRLHL